MPYLIHPGVRLPEDFPLDTLTPTGVNERAKVERELWYDQFKDILVRLPFFGKDWAEMIGVNEQTISRWRNRKSWPRRPMFDKFVDAVTDFTNEPADIYTPWVHNWVWGNRLITETHEDLLPEADTLYTRFITRDLIRSEKEWWRRIEWAVNGADIPFRERKPKTKERIEDISPTGAFPLNPIRRDSAGRIIGGGDDEPIEIPTPPTEILK